MGWKELAENKEGLFCASERESAVSVFLAGKKYNKTDYSASLQDLRHAERLLVRTISGVPPESIYFLNQVHGSRVHIVSGDADPAAAFCAEADALVSLKKACSLVIRTADCCAVLFSAPGGIAAAHSGWRGTRENIAARTLSQLCSSAGTKAVSVHAWLMPCISPASCQVQEDVAVHFPRHVRKTENGLFLNLQGAIAEQLLEEGLPEQNIHRTQLDTYRDNKLFYSHRRGDQGRNLNIIVLSG